jgi:hypothetical protein
MTAFIRPYPKYYLPACIAFVAIVTYGVALWWRKSPVAVTIMALVLCGAAATELPAVVRGEPLPWPEIARSIERNDAAGDLVLVHLWPDELTLRRYADGALDIRGILPISVPGGQSYAMTLAQYNPAQVVTADNIGPWLASATAGRSRVWLVFINDDAFFNGNYVPEWFQRSGWVASSSPDVRYAPKGTVTLYERRMP